MTGKTTLIFDLDGTLIHSAPDLHAALNAALAPLGRGPLDLATVTSFVGNGVEKLIERGLSATGGLDADLHRRTLAAFLTAYEADGVALTTVYDGVLPQLQRLRDRGKALGICTNKPEGPARHICDRLGLSPHFDVIIGAREGQQKKPDPAALMHTIQTLGAAPDDTLYVGDSTVDFRTAQAAGVDFWLYTGGYLNGDLPQDRCAGVFADWTRPDLFTG
ncbi:phosphoglycolate phosphatase [Roseobacter sinensis]|uniref:phosphoglycolate phosphatase n=1 Tax=Roseobacter sinensis TaxID=2931391 RepID=A0ABT3BC80_9RHOB|nr:phosphoglycolate phosphatase [Roseobacter sp. WL0113]MCV3270779.1 phosphoglycolate phosphatase [Roseobacter sp. WL0113]